MLKGLLSRMNYQLGVAVTGFVLMLAASFVIADDAAAGREVNSRLAYGNVGAYCGGGNAKGMVWISNYGPDYYSEVVSLGTNTTQVGVQVRGALNSCATTMRDSNTNEVWAVGVSSQTANLSISGNQFYRGNISRNTSYQWSYGHEGHPAGYLSATLNVGGVAPCSAAVGGISTGSVRVAIYRALQWRQLVGSTWTYYPGTPDTEVIDVPVRRTCPVDFQLNPSVTVDRTWGEVGATANAAASISNSLSGPASNIQWQLNTFTLSPSQAIPGPVQNGNAPSVQYSGAQQLSSGTGLSFAGSENKQLGSFPHVLPDEPPGSKICFVVSVQPYRHDNASWSHSEPRCVTIGKAPKVQVLGGDLRIGRGSATNPARISDINTSTTVKNGSIYGSWAEYGVIPSGCVTGMASGAGYAGGAPAGTAFQSLSLLTFTVPGRTINASKTCAVGGYIEANLAPNVSARFPINVPAAVATPIRPADPQVLGSSNVNLSALSKDYQASAGTTALTVSASAPINAGQWVVINAPQATVTITGDIRYTTGALSALDQIPQVVIIAKNIIIADGVTQIDAWLVASGSDVGGVQNGVINTCGTGGSTARPVTQISPLTIADCSQQLTVNGPVIANHLILRRTFGSGVGNESGAAAEVFNLRADAYLWATSYNLSTGRLSTIATKELPPRF